MSQLEKKYSFAAFLIPVFGVLILLLYWFFRVEGLAVAGFFYFFIAAFVNLALIFSLAVIALRNRCVEPSRRTPLRFGRLVLLLFLAYPVGLGCLWGGSYLSSRIEIKVTNNSAAEVGDLVLVQRERVTKIEKLAPKSGMSFFYSSGGEAALEVRSESLRQDLVVEAYMDPPLTGNRYDIEISESGEILKTFPKR